MWPDHVAQEIDALAKFADRYLMRMEGKPQSLSQKLGDPWNERLQLRFRFTEDDEVVGVTKVETLLEFVLHPLIKLIHVDVGEELTGQIADR